MNAERTPAFYMANLGPEIKRAVSFYERGMEPEYQGALLRVDGIVEQFLVAGPTNGGRAEIVILSNLLRNVTENHEILNPHALDAYFTPFALRVLAHR